MGISLASYRQVIGSFQCRGQKNAKIIHTGWKSSPETEARSKLKCSECIKISEILLGLACWTTIFIIANGGLWASPQTTKPALQICESLSKHQVHYVSLACIKITESFGLFHRKGGINYSFEANTNKLVHSLTGNRRNLGYKYFVWNCDRAFLSDNKMEDIKVFVEQKKPHVFSIIEVNIQRNEENKNLESKSQLSTEQVLDQFHIQDYNIILPDSWMKHDVARIICYVHSDIKAKKIQLNDDESHLQTVLLEIGFGRASSHLVCMYYREWKSYVTGKSDSQSRQEDLQKLLNIWARCTSSGKDFVSLGDLNLCSRRWDDPTYQHSGLANLVKDFLISENCCHLVNEVTRIRQVNDSGQQSSLDQIISNCAEKMSKPEILGVGKSDHLGILTTKFSREVRMSTRTTKKRIYKEFNAAQFKEDILKAKQNGEFANVHLQEDVDEAINVFTSAYNSVLNLHAPIRIIQNRNNYIPYISKEIKLLMSERNKQKIIAAQTGRTEDFNKYKRLRNQVVSKLKRAKETYYQEKFNDPTLSPNDTWKNAYQLLGSSKSSFPRRNE